MLFQMIRNPITTKLLLASCYSSGATQAFYSTFNKKENTSRCEWVVWSRKQKHTHTHRIDAAIATELNDIANLSIKIKLTILPVHIDYKYGSFYDWPVSLYAAVRKPTHTLRNQEYAFTNNKNNCNGNSNSNDNNNIKSE